MEQVCIKLIERTRKKQNDRINLSSAKGKTTILYRLQVGEVVTTIPSMLFSVLLLYVFTVVSQ
jgi:hypothetical protein